MKPMIILHPDAMDEDNIKLLRENGICVVIAKEPSALKFVDPLPAVSCRDQIEMAAIKLSRILLHKETCPWGDEARGTVARLFVSCLAKGTPLDSAGTIQEQEQKIMNQARIDEISKIAREEAREERAKVKVQKIK